MENQTNYGLPQEDGMWSTRDLTLASTLVTLKFFLKGFDIQYEGEKNRPVAYFKFDMTPLLESARQKYLQGLLAVEPKAFMLNVHSLKSEIENSRRNPHNQV